jgi:hypothetical protein
MTKENRNFFRVACEFQIRSRKIDEKELEMFRSFAMRPSQYSTLRYDLEHQFSSLNIREESKTLFEKAFQILINIDQRLERIEEQIQALRAKDEISLQNYEWIHGDLSAGGIYYHTDTKINFSVSDIVLIDLLLPSLPEYRVVAAARVSRAESQELAMEFEAIHSDDQEFIHRFVMSREREMLRARAKERDNP